MLATNTPIMATRGSKKTSIKTAPKWMYKPPPARVFTAVGDLSDNYLKRREILILGTIPATGVQLDYVECNMLQQFPHYRLDVGYEARLNYRSICHNWSPTEYRLGEAYSTAPEASDHPVIMTLVNRYSNMKPFVIGSDDDILSSSTCIKEHHVKQSMDISKKRLYHFMKALGRFVNIFRYETYNRRYLKNVKTVVIPYLLGNGNVEEWMSMYFPELIRMTTRYAAQLMGVDFVFLIPRVINSMDFFTPNIRKYTELKKTFGKFPIYGFYPQTIVPRITANPSFSTREATIKRGREKEEEDEQQQSPPCKKMTRNAANSTENILRKTIESAENILRKTIESAEAAAAATTITYPLEKIFIKQKWEEEEEEEKEYKIEIKKEPLSPENAMDEEPAIKQE